MIYKLSHEEVLKVCNSCEQFLKDQDTCRNDETGEPKVLKEVHHCKKWDEYFGGACVRQG